MSSIEKENRYAIFLTPDSRLFDTTDLNNPTPILYYRDQLGDMQKIGLKKDSVCVIYVNYPIFLENNGAFLVYPGEKLQVGVDSSYNLSFTTSDRSRNTELLFLKQYEQLIISRRSEILNTKSHMTFTEIFYEYKKNGTVWDQKRLEIFDSLVNRSHVSSRFSDLTRNYIKAHSHKDELANLYFFNKYSIENENIRQEFFNYLLACTNSIESTTEIQFGTSIMILEAANNILPEKIKNIQNTEVFEKMFDSAISKFKNISRDFLLLKILESAYNNNVYIPTNYLTKFDSLCGYSIYKARVKYFNKALTYKNRMLNKRGTNALLELSDQGGFKQTNIEDVLRLNKGKVVLIDLWASWCVPCIKEYPLLQQLKEKYPLQKMVVVSISFDKQPSIWREFILSKAWSKENQFAFVHSEKSDLVQKYKIEEIPRYMLIDKEGNMINPNAPRPSDSALSKLIEHYL